MLEVTQNDKILKILDSYYDALSGMGYVNDAQKQNILTYLFLVDFVNDEYDYFTEEDYALMIKALKNLFTNGGCLMPYSVFKQGRLFVGNVTHGAAHYIGDVHLRASEDIKVRLAQDYNVRLAIE